MGVTRAAVRKIIIASAVGTAPEVVDALRAEHYEPLFARTGGEVLRRLAETPDVRAVLMDIDLEQELGGIHTAQEILSDPATAATPLIFYAGRTDPDAIEAARRVEHAGLVPQASPVQVLLANLDAVQRNAPTPNVDGHEDVPEASEFMDAIMEAAQEGITVLDTDLTIRHADRVMHEWYRDSVPLVGKKCYHAFHGRSAPCERCPTLRTLRSGEMERDLIPGLPDSQVEWVEVFSYPLQARTTGRITGAVEFVRDVTEQRRTRADLEESKNRAERFLGAAAAIVLAIERDGTISLLNDSGHRLLGYEPGTLIGENWYETCVPEHSRGEVRAVLTGLLEGGDQSGSLHENAVLTRAGEERTVLWHNAVLSDEGAEGYALLCSGEDITERKRMEQALKKRLAYEAAVTEVARILAQPDGSISTALGHLLDATQSSRVYVFENGRNDRGELCLSLVAEACAPGVSKQIYNPEMQLLPYESMASALRENLEAGRPFDARVRELPNADRRILESQDVEHLLLLPIFGRGKWLGFIGFDQCYYDRAWPAEDVEVLRSVAAMVGNALARRHAEEKLQSHLTFQNLVSEVSARFVRAVGADLDVAIDSFLQQVGTHFGADRSYLFRFSDDRETVSNTHEWCSSLAEPQIHGLQNIPRDRVRHLVGTLTKGHVLHVPDLDDLPADARSEREHLRAQSIQSMLNVPVVTQGRVTGFLGFDSIREARRWTPEQIRGTRVVADVLAGALETQRAIEALEKERNLMHLLLKTSVDFVFFKDAEGRFTRVSDSLARAFGYESASAVAGTTSADHFGGERAEGIAAEEREMMETGLPRVAADAQLSWPTGQKSWVSTIKAPLFDARGNAVGIFGIARDVTERREAEEAVQRLLEEKELVLREVHHRIKNNMTSVQSLLSLQADMIDDSAARTAIEEAKGRLRSMEVLYDKLYRSGVVTEMSVREYLDPLIEEIVRLFAEGTAVSLNTHVQEASLPVRTLSTLGLIVNELVTNSMKHAFPDATKGAITLELTCGQEGSVTLHYHDNGVGIPDEVISGERTGLGMVLIQSLTEQLEGRVELQRNNGTDVQISFRVAGGKSTHTNPHSSRFS